MRVQASELLPICLKNIVREEENEEEEEEEEDEVLSPSNKVLVSGLQFVPLLLLLLELSML